MSYTHHCAQAHELKIGTRSSFGGSKSLGEMECTQLVASGLTNCLQEFINRSDMCFVDVCRGCDCLLIVCVCDEQGQKVNRMKLPYRTIKFIIASKVGFDLNIRLRFE